MHPAVAITTALAAVIGLAIVAVTFSKQGQAPQVISAAGTALSGVINAAVSPITQTGGSVGLSNSAGNYTGSSFGLPTITYA